ncbi:MAG: extracellular solute-binding protein [Lachnospiraceae bacterium]|nr:extracellular solute-binding protein [Lachnospiraceae bacterium]
MKKKKWITAIVIIAVLAAIILFSKCGKDEKVPDTNIVGTSSYESSYLAYLTENYYTGQMADASISVDISDYKTRGAMKASYADGFLSTSEEGFVTWTFNVEEEGFYNMKLTYLSLPGTTSDVQRSLTLDGKICYDALSQIVLKRQYSDENIETKNDDEIRPAAVEVFESREVYIEDYGRRNGAPLLFYLTKGEHTISFESVKEPVAIKAIEFTAKEEESSYEEVIETLKALYPVYSGETLVGQAERRDGITKDIIKSSSSININKNYSDSNLMPYHPYNIVYNTIGGSSYKTSGDFITWEMEVPEDGLYAITIKGRQAINRGVTSYRRISVNGVVPYAELNEYAFNYNSDMTNYTLSDNNGEPYLFYLKKGTNTFTMEVVLGALGSVVTEVEESMYNLNMLYIKTTQITGTVPSKYIDYEIRKKVDGFVETLTAEYERLAAVCNEMVAITGERGEQTALLEKMAFQAMELANDPESATEQLAKWKDNVSALGTWLVTISEMPLEIDAIYISDPEGKLPNPGAGFFKSAYYGVVRFFASFFNSTSELNTDQDTKGSDVLTVWMVSSGKEQAQILQNMVDETFTPEYGIKVKLQLIPVGVVLRAALSGNAPDVLVGLSQGTLADFAMRNALVDMSTFEDFDTEAARFYESAIKGASYCDGVYGLPETQTFMMLFARNDILSSLGVEVPKTWEEVKELIPILQRNNYDFCMPTSGFYPSLVFQYGGDLYYGSGKDYGISSALASDAAMSAFKDLTDYFTAYQLPVTMDFSNRFRTGETPIGLVNYTTYCTLEIFAPEIKGLWSFYPIPGVLKEDGSIDNTYISDTSQSVIMSSSNNVEDAWTFIKWWTGTEAQLSYANTIESVMGTSARYAPADKDVLARLPWSTAELKQLMAQLENTVGIPAVPGSYMTSRMISYSFDDVVANASNPRETLYLNIKAIDKELIKKRVEFSLSTEDDE